jgi:hypothetical protein
MVQILQPTGEIAMSMKSQIRSRLNCRRISAGGLVVGFLVVLLISARAQGQDTLSAREMVEKYCSLEFSGDTSFDRSSLIEYSKERELLEQKEDPDFEGRLISWTTDSIYVVDGYTVDGLKTHDTAGVCIVIYETLAKSKGYGDADRELVPQKIIADSVSLKLVYEHNNWRVLDPPPPRISDAALLKIYEKDVDVTTRALSDTSKLTIYQKKYVENLKKTLKILMELKK